MTYTQIWDAYVAGRSARSSLHAADQIGYLENFYSIIRGQMTYRKDLAVHGVRVDKALKRSEMSR